MSGRIPALSALKGRMQWLQARQAVLAGNVAHADTPGFRPRDLAPATAETGRLALTGTSPGHLGPAGRRAADQSRAANAFETRPSGNGVSLEEEMLKLADTQVEYQLAAGLYQRSIAYLRTSLGRRG